MPFPDDLLVLARELAADPPTSPTQARLRRAVSTAYYALFHLLIGGTVSKWPIERHRNILARTFTHGQMKRTCEEVLRKEKRGDVPPALALVAKAFIQLQQHRHTADHDNSKQWSRAEVEKVLDSGNEAFEVWKDLNHDEAPDFQDAAQDFLLQLFLPNPLDNSVTAAAGASHLHSPAPATI